MKKTIFFHTSASKNSFNAQDLNGREIACRLNSMKYHIHIFSEDNFIDERLIADNITIHIIPFKNKYLKIRKYDERRESNYNI